MPLQPHFRNLLTALNDDILFDMMNDLNLSDLISLRATSPHYDALVGAYLTSHLRMLLAQFFDEVETIRGLMCNTNSIISGSSALAFVLPKNSDWNPHDLDLYVPYGQFAHVVAFLEVYEGYSDITPQNVMGHYTGAVERVIRLQKGDRFVDVIQSGSESALQPLACFWLTAVINYLSADYAYVAYPDLTFAHRALLHPNYLHNFHSIKAEAILLVDKYQAHGFDIRIREVTWSHHPAQAGVIMCNRKGACASVVRFFGDEFGLTTTFNASDTITADITTRQHLTVLWRRGIPCGVGCVGRPGDVTTYAEVVGV